MPTTNRAASTNTLFVFNITPAIVLCVLLASCGVFPSFNAAMTLEGQVKDQDGHASALREHFEHGGGWAAQSRAAAP